VVNYRSLLITVGLGQTLSLLICGTAVASGLLQIQHVLVPTGTLTTCLNIVFIPLFLILVIGIKNYGIYLYKSSHSYYIQILLHLQTSLSYYSSIL